MTYTINFRDCLHSPGTQAEYGHFSRVRATPPTKQDAPPLEIIRDQRQASPFIWGSLSIPAEPGQTFKLCLDQAQLLNVHTDRGWLLKQNDHYLLIPAQPRLLVLDQQHRIQNWTELGWQSELANDHVALTIVPTQAGVVEVIWLKLDQRDVADLVSEHPLERETWAVEGCWSRLKGLSNFFQFWALGRIYSGRFASHGRFLSGQTAWSLYKIASVLKTQTAKPFYRNLMAEWAYTMLANLNEAGAWENGEWLAKPEVHARFQLDGVHLLLTAYQQFGDGALLLGARRAADFVLNEMKDELANGGWWFLHDTLELDENLFKKKNTHFYVHNHFGKKPTNTLALNTHLSALHVFYRLAQISDDQIYSEAYCRGLDALQSILNSPKGRLIHSIAEKLLVLSFENQPAPRLRRGMRHLIRGQVRPWLSSIQKFWPSFTTSGGYLWRDMTLPAWGYWYHLVNLYDLLMLYQLDPQDWLRELIEKAVRFSFESNLAKSMLANQHYLAPQWLQILKAYASLGSSLDSQYLEQARQQIQRHGYGIPPEYYTSDGTFLCPKTKSTTTILT